MAAAGSRALRRGPASALTLAIVVIAGCGGISDGDAERFATDADAICKETRTKAEGGGQPRTLGRLAERASSAHATQRTGARRLHDLRTELGDSVPSTIERFDGKLDAVVSLSKRLSEDAALEDAGAVRKSAERLRSGGDELYKAAQAAGMKQCGRGGNRAADRALFAAYREEYGVVLGDLTVRVFGLSGRGDPGSLSESARRLDSLRTVVKNFRARLQHLAPPRDLRRTHRAVQRRSTALLRNMGGLERTVRRGRSVLLNGEYDVAFGRFSRSADRFDAADRQLWRLLNGRPENDSGSGRGDTNTV